MASPKKIAPGVFSPDILTFIRLLEKYAVRYMIVGGEAVIYHGYPRVTGDVDFFYEPTRKNTEKLWAVLKEFWDGKIPGLRNSAELMEPGLIIQFGRPPHRLDLMNAIDGVSFSAAWRSHLRVQLGKSKDHTSYIGLRTLIKNKRASGRHKDLQDTEHLKKKPGAH
ncbi:MAG: hypothetical protein ABI443_02605 [Chthoniobacterales bacterium]